MDILYLHIGTHKTGTTSLQTFFKDNEVLLKKKGIIYPKTGRARMGAHHHLISSICIDPHPIYKPRKSFVKYIKLLENEVPTGFCCLISSEIFNEIIDFSQLEMFKTVAKKVKIIVYLRRQDYFLESGYSLEVRQGYKMPFEYYCDQWSLNYSDLCDKYADVFGKENIIVRPYEKQQFHGGNIFSDFLNVLGLELTREYRFPKKNPNPSLSRDALEYMYCINRLPLTEEEVYSFSSIMLKFSGRTGKDAIFLSHNILSREKRITLLKKYIEGNAEVACEYLGRLDGKLFYEPFPELKEENKPYPGLTDEIITQITCFIRNHSLCLIMVLKHGVLKGLTSDKPDEYQAARTLTPVLKFEKTFFENILIWFVRQYYKKKQTFKKTYKQAKQCMVKFNKKWNFL